MPKIPRALTPTTKRMPMLMSCAIWNAGPMAKPANESSAAPTESTGASQKTSLSALSGMMSSLMSNFTASAIGCNKPCGPTRIGPSRACMFALWRFNRMLNLARWRLQYLSYFRHDWSGGNIFDGLEADQTRLPHLFHADQIAVVRVTGCADSNLELVLIVRRVRRGLADVPLHAAGPQHWPGHAKCDGVRRRQNSHAFRPPDPDAVLREQLLVFHDARFEILAESLNILLEGVVSLVLQPADAEGMSGQARAAVLFKNFQDFLAFAETVEERSERADV